jgi:WD40 repeat protein
MKKSIPLILVVYILILVGTIILPGCSRSVPIDGRDNPQASNITQVSFSTRDLPPIFQIVVGGKYIDNFNNLDHTLALNEILGENSFLPDSFWLISPFYEPQEFFFRDFDQTLPLDLGSLSRTMTFKKIEIRQETPTILEAGPYASRRYSDNDGSSFYAWASEKALMLYSPPQGVGLVDLDPQHVTINQPILNFLNVNCLTVSPDARKVAYIENGYLVICNLQTNKKQKWGLTKNPDAQTFSTFATELLEWSPNGRYILGSNNAYYDYYLAKLWALDLETGRISKFNARNSHAYCQPIWSPDGKEVVVTELFKPYTEAFRGQWILLNLRSKKLTSLAPKEKINTSYDFTWNSSGKLEIRSRLSNLVEAFDPRLKLEQHEFLASKTESGVRYLATGLRIFSPEGEEKFVFDLQPALEKSGLHLDDMHTLYIDPLKTADEQYLFLQGRASTLNKVRTYNLYGRVNLSTQQVLFLKPIWSTETEKPFVLDTQFLRGSNEVLLVPEKKTIHILNIDEMQIHELLFSKPLLAVIRIAEKILYITRDGIFLTSNLENTLPIHLAESGEEYLQGIKLSPEGRYLAVPSKKPYTGMLDKITLTIIDLQALKNALKS